MATTLSALKLPSLRIQSKLQPNTPSTSVTPSKLNLNVPFTLTNQDDIVHSLKSCALSFPALALPFILNTQDALAVEGQFGLLEGRTAALIHPAVMGGLFAYTLWAGYLGWQWRRIRTIQNEITRPICCEPH